MCSFVALFINLKSIHFSAVVLGGRGDGLLHDGILKKRLKICYMEVSCGILFEYQVLAVVHLLLRNTDGVHWVPALLTSSISYGQISIVLPARPGC